MAEEFTHIGTTIQEVLKRAQAMSKRYEKQISQDEHSTVECKDCGDTGTIIEKKEVEYYGKVIKKDFGRPCHCVEKKSLQRRFKNALIPEEFKNARFDNYEVYDQTTKTLFEATQEYLRSLDKILKNGDKHNSLGFIAVLGESRIRAMKGEEKYIAKERHNNFGLGKTHLQIAAAKWILNNIKIRDEIAPGQYSKFERGCRVLCVSDITFMEDLTNAKMLGDGGEELNRLIYDAINVDILVWDDMGKSKWSETKEGFYYRIINERYINKRPIIFSSNEDQGTLADKIGYAASSRLFGMCGERLYEVEGDDYRLRKR